MWRQADPEFVRILNDVRAGRGSQALEALVQRCMRPLPDRGDGIKPTQASARCALRAASMHSMRSVCWALACSRHDIAGSTASMDGADWLPPPYVQLFARNADVDRVNDAELSALPGTAVSSGCHCRRRREGGAQRWHWLFAGLPSGSCQQRATHSLRISMTCKLEKKKGGVLLPSVPHFTPPSSCAAGGCRGGAFLPRLLTCCTPLLPVLLQVVVDAIDEVEVLPVEGADPGLPNPTSSGYGRGSQGNAYRWGGPRSPQGAFVCTFSQPLQTTHSPP